jgi:hypothetical protein
VAGGLGRPLTVRLLDAEQTVKKTIVVE